MLWLGTRAGFPGAVPTQHSLDTLSGKGITPGDSGPGLQGRYLEDGVGLQQPVLDGLDLLAGRAGDSVVLQDLLGGLGFAGAALAGDEDALILPLGAQRAVGIVCDGVAGRGQPGLGGLPVKSRQTHPPKKPQAMGWVRSHGSCTLVTTQDSTDTSTTEPRLCRVVTQIVKFF